MDIRSSMTINDAATSLGLAPSTLRVQIRNGALKATKFGSVWVIDADEVERYRSKSRGNPGNRRQADDE
jgi:excisionase family DNA binding protein